MNAAAKIVEKLGGTRRAAATLGVAPSTVQSWKAVGRIPAQHQVRVLTVARDQKISIEPGDFFVIDDAPVQLAPPEGLMA